MIDFSVLSTLCMITTPLISLSRLSRTSLFLDFSVRPSFLSWTAVFILLVIDVLTILSNIGTFSVFLGSSPFMRALITFLMMKPMATMPCSYKASLAIPLSTACCSLVYFLSQVVSLATDWDDSLETSNDDMFSRFSSSIWRPSDDITSFSFSCYNGARKSDLLETNVSLRPLCCFPKLGEKWY